MEHKTISLADQVFERLERNILTGVYAQGAVLTEMKLVEDMGVSRTPIREAVRKLEQEQIVEITPKGLIILGVTKEDLEDIYAIRLRIEGLAAAYAAERISDGQLAELKEALDLQEYYVGRQDPEHIIRQDSDFHELLYHASGSMVLYHTLLPLHKKVQKYRKVSVEDAVRAHLSIEEHRAICDALSAHDKGRAEQAAIAHVRNAREHILNKAD